jgi:predicted lipoprotein with Yx(FWY)xxD motif
MPRTRTLLAGLGVAALVAGLVGGSLASASQSHARKAVARSTESTTLDKRILVTQRGMTLYSLSVERGGRFICKDSSCLALWKPLVVTKGTVPTGAASLATIKRPDGRTQVTYKGRPLYTFTMDRKPGDVRGNGFKDVGTWLAASSGASSTPTTTPAPTTPTTPTPPTNTNPYGY